MNDIEEEKKRKTKLMCENDINYEKKNMKEKRPNKSRVSMENSCSTFV